MASATTSDSIYIFKIWLKYIKPRIWRRVEVPADYSFFDLHVAVQDLFQWSDTHLHQFEMLHRNRDFSEKVLSGNFELDEYIGIPDRAMVDDMKILPEKETKICDHFAMTVNKKKCVYVYDFGAEWVKKYFHGKFYPLLSAKNIFGSYRSTKSLWRILFRLILMSCIRDALLVNNFFPTHVIRGLIKAFRWFINFYRSTTSSTGTWFIGLVHCTRITIFER